MKKKTILPIFLATVWIGVSEFARGSFSSAPLGPPLRQARARLSGEAGERAVWGLWSLLFAVAIYISEEVHTGPNGAAGLVRRFRPDVGRHRQPGRPALPDHALAVPLSLLEAFVAAFIVKRLSRTGIARSHFVDKSSPGAIGEVFRKLAATISGEGRSGQAAHVERQLWYVKPDKVRIVTDELRKAGSRPVLYDTAIVYGGQRNTREKYRALATEHGFDAIGCDVVIGDRGPSVDLAESGYLLPVRGRRGGFSGRAHRLRRPCQGPRPDRFRRHDQEYRNGRSLENLQAGHARRHRHGQAEDPGPEPGELQQGSGHGGESLSDREDARLLPRPARYHEVVRLRQERPADHLPGPGLPSVAGPGRQRRGLHRDDHAGRRPFGLPEGFLGARGVRRKTRVGEQAYELVRV